MKQNPANSNTKISNDALRGIISEVKTKGNHDRSISQPFGERFKGPQFREQYDPNNHSLDIRNSSITKASHLSDSNIQDHFDFNTTKETNSVFVTSDEYTDNSREFFPQPGICREDLISYPSSTGDASDIHSTKVGVELMPRLPSK